jgi:N-acetylglutamate synthase-like GNAT family acetyltransferase
MTPPEPVAEHHDIQSFDCGKPTLNDWLKTESRKSQQVGGSARTYVVCTEDGRVIGYYALATGSVNREDAPGKVKRNMPDPIPVVIIGRLAVDESFSGRGTGAGLLKDALLRIVNAAGEIGIRAVLVHALDGSARNFYLKHGFCESPTNELTLMVGVQDIETALGA